MSTPHTDDSTASLIGGVVNDAKDLVAAHAERAKIEAKHELGNLNRTIKVTGIAVASIVVAAVMLGCALSLGLVELGVPPWAAFGLVAIVAGLGGVIAIKQRPPSEDRDVIPDESIKAMRQDADRLVEAVRG